VSRAPLAAGVLLTAVLAGCSLTSAPDRAAEASRTAAPATPGAASGAPATPRPAAATPSTAYRTGAPRTGPPATLAGLSPTGPDGWSARFWFAGIPVGRDGGRLLVAYPSVEAWSDGDDVVAHAKLALFRCVRRAAPRSPNFLGCTGRRVEYGDLAAPELRVIRDATGALTLTGEFTTYSYGVGVDRGPGLPVRWTGRTFPLRVSSAPAGPRPGGTGTSTASAAIGTATSRGRAGLDLGYPNRRPG
jgi:hypothetical protein